MQQQRMKQPLKIQQRGHPLADGEGSDGTNGAANVVGSKLVNTLDEVARLWDELHGRCGSGDGSLEGPQLLALKELQADLDRFAGRLRALASHEGVEGPTRSFAQGGGMGITA